jgi:hypothetical protein
MTQDNEEALEQEYNRILGESEETIKNEDKIAEKTIESSEEKNESDIKEGEKIPSEIEEELKNIDPELREILLKADSETRKAQVNAFNKMRSTIDKKHTEFGHQKKIAEAAQSLFDKYGIDPNSGFSQIEKLIEFEKAYEENPEKIVSLLQAKINKTRNETGSEIDEEQFTEQEKYLFKKIKSID